jgi:hypothetical protein
MPNHKLITAASLTKISAPPIRMMKRIKLMAEGAASLL